MALAGIRVLELAGLAPAPFCGMILADFGAKVVCIDRVDATAQSDPYLSRGKQSMTLNLKHEEGRELFKKLSKTSDVIIEPFRAGIMERLGLAPSVLMKENPRLIYARLTGFGQSGSFAHSAGHDINYIALSGVLSMLGRKNENPLPPINLLGDFAGGGLLCAFGIVMSLFERTRSGKGQVIDANMVEGSAYIGSWLWLTKKSPIIWPSEKKGENLLDGGVPFYNTYKTLDNRYMAVGALEPQFFNQFIKGLNLSEDEISQFDDFETNNKKFAQIFATKSQAEWCKIFDNTDSCVTPILSLDEAASHPHNVARRSFITNSDGEVSPRPAPDFSRTPGLIQLNKPKFGQHTEEILAEAGLSNSVIQNLAKLGVIKLEGNMASHL